jgi:hypothetical protein
LFGCTILTLFGAHLADNSGRLRRRRTRVPRAATTPRSTIAMGTIRLPMRWRRVLSTPCACG